VGKDKKRILITLSCESCELTTENDPSFVVTSEGKVYHKPCYESVEAKIWNDLHGTFRGYED